MGGLLRKTKLFGSRTRTTVLVLLAMLEESYPSELARLLDARLYTIQNIIDALESETIIVSRVLGRTRRITLNPRYAAATELRALLAKLGESDIELQKIAATKRARPRRPGKPG
jgi:DNA-binding MarR family transcriptional regulator